MWRKGDLHACIEEIKQDFSQSITEIPSFTTHKIPRQIQEILKGLQSFLVSGATPDKFISAARITALGKKALISNTYLYHKNAALSPLGCGTRWDVQAWKGTVSGRGW